MSRSDKPSRDYGEWLRQKGWPFLKRDRGREGADSVLPHLEEFLEQSKLLGKHQEVDKDKDNDSKPGRDKPQH